MAGLLADGVASQAGPVGPLLATLPFLLVAFLVPYTSWSENFGDATISLRTTLAQGLGAIASSKRVFLLGLMQTLFEGSMHVFVFMWTPTLQGATCLELIHFVPFIPHSTTSQNPAESDTALDVQVSRG